ncbi:MAG: PH domain-containing protein [Dysgonamonadaceae bacterium]|jgi:energy-coupling factor transporter transmembrane protein EcfT|nr:PH domain-containing protein [Dysgonamonadaceae bacterium]
MIFSCPWDTKVALITIAYSAVLLLVIIGLLIPLIRYIKVKRILPVALLSLGILLFTGILVISAIDCPMKVSIETELLTIHRIQGNIVIPIESIEEIRLCENVDTRDSKRILGSGGAFGYLGKFRNVPLGDYLMYVTNVSQKILVKTNGKYIVFSCDEPARLVETIKQLNRL